jgi:hypothetical protein
MTDGDGDESNSIFGNPDLLELFLNLRPTPCVVPMEAWGSLTIRDLAQLPLMSKSLHRQLKIIAYNKC